MELVLPGVKDIGTLAMHSRRHKRINGFTLPKGCPSDFTHQVQSVVSRHNLCVDDCIKLQKAVNESKEKLAECEAKLTNIQEKYDKSNSELADLKMKHKQLELTSKKLAEKYERVLQAERSDVDKSDKSDGEDED